MKIFFLLMIFCFALAFCNAQQGKLLTPKFCASINVASENIIDSIIYLPGNYAVFFDKLLAEVGAGKRIVYADADCKDTLNKAEIKEKLEWFSDKVNYADQKLLSMTERCKLLAENVVKMEFAERWQYNEKDCRISKTIISYAPVISVFTKPEESEKKALKGFVSLFYFRN